MATYQRKRTPEQLHSGKIILKRKSSAGIGTLIENGPPGNRKKETGVPGGATEIPSRISLSHSEECARLGMNLNSTKKRGLVGGKRKGNSEALPDVRLYPFPNLDPLTLRVTR